MELYDIECLIAKKYDPRRNLIVCRVSWGLLNHEADVIVMNKNGWCTEIEIKRTWADFLADFKKKHTHDDERIEDFHYCVPEEIEEKVVSYFVDNGLKCGLMVYSEKEIKTIFIDSSGRHARKLFLEERYQLARLGAMKYWKNFNNEIK